MVPHLGHTEVMVVVVAGDGFYADIGQTQKKKKNAITFTECRGGLQHCKSLGLTFAGLHALKPTMIYLFIWSTSTVLVPSTARSAATDSVGFRKRAALWTPHRIRNC